MNIVFFKRPQPKRFDYKPLYYDERKDELDQRKKKFQITDNEEKKEAIKSEIHYRWGLHRKTSKGKNSVTTLIFYLFAMVILIMFVYYLMNSIGMDLIF